MTTEELNEKIGKVRRALIDPDAPWYGSDLVHLVGDTLTELQLQISELRRERLVLHRRITTMHADLEVTMSDYSIPKKV